MLADVVHEGGVNPRHERGDGFPGVVGRRVASPTNLELQASGCRGVRTLGQDLLGGIVVLLSVVVVRVGLMGCSPGTHLGHRDRVPAHGVDFGGAPGIVRDPP